MNSTTGSKTFGQHQTMSGSTNHSSSDLQSSPHSEDDMEQSFIAEQGAEQEHVADDKPKPKRGRPRLERSLQSQTEVRIRKE